ncbi:hypothetical protein TMEC54S_00124 [Thauera mechernichensis]|uniref:type IV secretion system protein n=1 Tax=Thauera sp. 27 TaxID=305700 RepID=UPI0009FADEA6|nr:type IV secretion system protein [Thauera sp. 27]
MTHLDSRPINARLFGYLIAFFLVFFSASSFGQQGDWEQDQLRTFSESQRNAELAEARQRAEEAQKRAYAAGLSLQDQVRKVIDDLRSSINSKASLLVPEGKFLLSALSLIAVSWLGIRLSLQGASASESMAEAVQLIFIIGIATWVVTSSQLTGEIMKGFDDIAGRIMGAATSSGSDTNPALNNQVDIAVRALVESVIRIYEQPNGFSLKDPTSWSALPVMIMKVFMAMFLLAVTLAYMAMFVMTQVMFGVALILAPVLVPFYVIQPLSFIAIGWFKFLLSAGMAKVAGALILMLTVGFLQETSKYLSAINPDEGAPLIIYSGVFLITGIMAVMMMQAWSIGAAIMTGISRVSGGLPSKLQPGGLANATSTSMQGGMNQGARAMNMTVGTAAGAISGAKAASSSGSSRIGGAAAGGRTGLQAARQTMDGKAAKTSMSPIRAALNASAAARGGSQSQGPTRTTNNAGASNDT